MNRDKFNCVLVVLSAFLIIATVDGIMSVIGIYISEWLTEFHTPRFQLDWIGSLQLGISYCLGPFAGKLVRNYGYIKVTMSGGLVCALSFLACGFTAHISMLYVFYGILSGIGFGMAYMSAVVAITLSFEKYRPIAMGLVTCGTGIGSSAMSIAIPVIIKTWGWRKSMFTLALLSTNLCIFGVFLNARHKKTSRPTMASITAPQLANLEALFENSPRIPSQIMSSTFGLQSVWNLEDLDRKTKLTNFMGNMGSFAYLEHVDLLLPKLSTPGRSRLRILKNVDYILLLLASFLIAFVFMTPVVYLFDRLRTKHFPDSEISLIISGYGVCGAFARLAVGISANFEWCKKRIYIFSWVVIFSLIVLSSNYMHAKWQFAIFSCVLGCASGAFIVLQPLVLTEIISKEDLTEGLGLMLMAAGAGYLTGTPVMATMYDKWKNYDVCYLCCSVILGIAAVLLGVMMIKNVKQLLMDQYEKRLKRMLERAMEKCQDEQSEESTH